MLWKLWAVAKKLFQNFDASGQTDKSTRQTSTEDGQFWIDINRTSLIFGTITL